jgi:hypothetical protein
VHHAYIIEINDEAVGIAAQEPGGFRFHAALKRYSRLDGRLFPTLGQASRAARELMHAGDKHSNSGFERTRRHPEMGD